jgi:hypothetical protein
MGFICSRYYQTRNVEHAWPKKPVLYPTLTLFGIAATSLIFDVVTLCTYCYGVKAANKASIAATVIHTIITVMHAALWAAGTVLYKYANKTMKKKDIWGWSCSKAARALRDVNKSGVICESSVCRC